LTVGGNEDKNSRGLTKTRGKFNPLWGNTKESGSRTANKKFAPEDIPPVRDNVGIYAEKKGRKRRKRTQKGGGLSGPRSTPESALGGLPNRNQTPIGGERESAKRREKSPLY